jgi:hypothetical protein
MRKALADFRRDLFREGKEALNALVADVQQGRLNGTGTVGAES